MGKQIENTGFISTNMSHLPQNSPVVSESRKRQVDGFCSEKLSSESIHFQFLRLSENAPGDQALQLWKPQSPLDPGLSPSIKLHYIQL